MAKGTSGGGGGGGGSNSGSGGRGQGNGGGWPSTTGNPSGGGRSNGPPPRQVSVSTTRRWPESRPPGTTAVNAGAVG